MNPGPEIGRLLQAIEDARLEGTVQCRAEALTMAKFHINGDNNLETL